jgi:uncharacterized protein (DUF305 family)
MHRKHSFTLVLLIISLLASNVASIAFAQDDPTQRTRAERAEIRFLEGMIDHHQMALDMAADCLIKAETEAIRILCQNVIDAQSAEILTMRGWLLAWYHIDYHPMSMTQMQGGKPAMGMGMMDGDMMAQMMEMMMGMMENGMGMMGGMGGGQNGENGPAEMSNDMQMMEMMQIMHTLHHVTLGELMEMTADVDPATPFIEVLQQYVQAPMNGMEMGGVMDMAGMMENMTMGQMMVLFAQLQTLTLGDIQEMMGHLDDPENKTIMEMMQHHIETMVNAPAGSDHEAHHPEAEATPAADTAGEGEHDAHHPEGETPSEGDHNEGNPNEGDHSEHDATGTTAFVDPAMGMGMFAGFNYLTGVDYEIAWLEAMIDHHDDALHMSTRILEQAVHEELATFAQGIIDAQTAEIEQMEGLLVELVAESLSESRTIR